MCDCVSVRVCMYVSVSSMTEAGVRSGKSKKARVRPWGLAGGPAREPSGMPGKPGFYLHLLHSIVGSILCLLEEVVGTVSPRMARLLYCLSRDQTATPPAGSVASVSLCLPLPAAASLLEPNPGAEECPGVGSSSLPHLVFLNPLESG